MRKILILGAGGALGTEIREQLERKGNYRAVCPSGRDTDLRDRWQTMQLFAREWPDYVFFLAARQAGIQYKALHPASMFTDNMNMALNVFEAAKRTGCREVLNVATALIYPQDAQAPYKENMLKEAPVVGVDAPYALAKASSLMLARAYNKEYGTDYKTVIPCNFFGRRLEPEDRRGLIPSLISRAYQAKTERSPVMEVWGTGNACRDILAAPDVASACIYVMEHNVHADAINIGSGTEYSVRSIAETVKDVTGYGGKLIFDPSKPEGRMHMKLDTRILTRAGWTPSMDLHESIEWAYRHYRSQPGGTVA